MKEFPNFDQWETLIEAQIDQGVEGDTACAICAKIFDGNQQKYKILGYVPGYIHHLSF